MNVNKSIRANQVFIGLFVFFLLLNVAVAVYRHQLARPNLWFWLAFCALQVWVCVMRIRRIRRGPEPIAPLSITR